MGCRLIRFELKSRSVKALRSNSAVVTVFARQVIPQEGVFAFTAFQASFMLIVDSRGDEPPSMK